MILTARIHDSIVDFISKDRQLIFIGKLDDLKLMFFSKDRAARIRWIH